MGASFGIDSISIDPKLLFLPKSSLPALCATLRAARLRELRNLGIIVHIIHITPSTSTIKAPWLASRLRQTSFHSATNDPAVDLTSHIALGPCMPQAATPYDEVRGVEWRNPCSCDAGHSRRCGVAARCGMLGGTMLRALR